MKESQLFLSGDLPKVKMFIQTPDEVTEEFVTVGVISYKENGYSIKFPDGFDWRLRLLVIMASTTIETDLSGISNNQREYILLAVFLMFCAGFFWLYKTDFINL